MQVDVVKEIEPADGLYVGVFGGYRLAFEYGGETVSVHTKRGVRMFAWDVEFEVKGGEIIEASIKGRSLILRAPDIPDDPVGRILNETCGGRDNGA